ncbi:MAG TPA: DUF4388 domain-containing protein [Candidatus Paceibacterota bacterium]|nr:DUF4388 domain-containing protein [Verrucomicrobiota bacterium]HRY47026.1 DUF4388 domain-containing protein [Candidatus Paceibacterota bacterium]HSA03044.1 DUF4388 domain-containing protein [Candidatus Paceibacterota bacterium]
MVTKVALTGDPSGAYRQPSIEAGAELYLEKPRDFGGWEAIYTTLTTLLRHPATDGFRGVMRKVSLPDVVQMECLAHHSSILEIQTGGLVGSIFFEEGRVIHAQAGIQQGIDAFFSLLATHGGEFAVKPYCEPSNRTIQEPWEFLLMEAARKRDEQAASAEFPSGDFTPQSVTPSLFPEMAPAILRDVAEAFPILQIHRLTAVRIRWFFARLRIIVARRADGICLAIFLDANAGGEILEEADAVLDCFERLPTDESPLRT